MPKLVPAVLISYKCFNDSGGCFDILFELDDGQSETERRLELPQLEETLRNDAECKLCQPNYNTKIHFNHSLGQIGCAFIFFPFDQSS